MVENWNIFLLALNEIKHFGSKTIIHLYKKYLSSFPESKFDDQNFITFISNNSKYYNDDFIFEIENNIKKIEFELYKKENKDIRIISYFDDLYPYQLKFLSAPPLFLFCRGNLELLKEDNVIAVVGTRESSLIGNKVAVKTAEYFAKNGFTIVSGLAKGIDSWGHIGALNSSGNTIAILTDIKKIYPAENRELAEKILDNKGLLFSEIAPWKNIYRSAFVDRDRLQSGMSLGTFVIETDIKGGTMHTVKFTLEQNRLLYVPDYRVLPYEDNFSKINGTKYLLEEGKAMNYDKNKYEQIIQKLNNKKIELMNEYQKLVQNDKGLL